MNGPLTMLLVSAKPQPPSFFYRQKACFRRDWGWLQMPTIVGATSWAGGRRILSRFKRVSTHKHLVLEQPC